MPMTVHIDCTLLHRSWELPEADPDISIGEGPWRARAKIQSPTLIEGNGDTPAKAMAALSLAVVGTLEGSPIELANGPIWLDVQLRVTSIRFPKDRGGVVVDSGD